MPRIDFTGVESKDFNPIPKGKYLAELETHDWRTAESSGNDQLRLQYRIVDGDYEDRRMSAFCTITPKALWFLKMNLVACGIDPDALAGEIELEDNVIESLYDARVVLDVAVGEDQSGNPRNEIKNVASADSYTYA